MSKKTYHEADHLGWLGILSGGRYYKLEDERRQSELLQFDHIELGILDSQDVF